MNIEDKKQWQGYTLDQLRMRRLVTMARIEIQQAKIKHTLEGYTGNNGAHQRKSLVSRMFGAIDYVDYGIIAFQVIKRAASIFAKFRRKH